MNLENDPWGCQKAGILAKTWGIPCLITVRTAMSFHFHLKQRKNEMQRKLWQQHTAESNPGSIEQTIRSTLMHFAFMIEWHVWLSYYLVLIGAFISISSKSTQSAAGWKLWSLLPMGATSCANHCPTIYIYCTKVPLSSWQYKVHAGSFRVSVIPQTLTWTTGSLTCIRDHSHACVYTLRSLHEHTGSEESNAIYPDRCCSEACNNDVDLYMEQIKTHRG